MTAQEILDTVKKLLAIVGGQEACEDREGALRSALDQLAVAYHFTDVPFDETDFPDPHEADYGALREAIALRFPGLGCYEDMLRISESSEAERSIGDAVDDLADIAKDLHDILLRWETNGERDALWHFRFGFESHWGRHLRDLQLYLHERAF
jgi:hypothetical protein